MSDSGKGKNVMGRTCIVNVGHFRSGTTTLTKAAERLRLESYRKFPTLAEDQHNDFLHKPEQVVLDWISNGGLNEIIRLAAEYDIICDGWIALLPLLPPAVLDSLKEEARRVDIQLEFVASTRNVESTVKSELQHWTIYDLERNAGLDQEQRVQLEHSLHKRAMKHQRGVQHLQSLGVLSPLPLQDGNIAAIWSKTLSLVSGLTEENWFNALQYTGVQNANPPLPVEGILLTLRLGTGNESNEKIASVDRLLDQIEQDSLCRYLVVLAIDSDEEGSDGARDLIYRLKVRAEPKQQLQSFHLIINPPNGRSQPFAICSAWDNMATVAWKNGADWVCLMGDDIDVQCPYHYRAIYRSFLDISKRLQVSFGFGNPWWNDKTFPGFASFPCVGKAHYAIFGGLIPEHRRHCFVNQDLDPYLHHLYLKFMASPCVREAILFNRAGGNIGSSTSNETRYERVPAPGWQDFFLDDLEPTRKYLPVGTTEALLLDVIVPSYRVELDYLQSICSLKVPENFRTLFIIIVDNPKALLRWAVVIVQQNTSSGNLTPCPGGECTTLDQGERILEENLSKSGGNHVRVRCNKTNLGASASRNRGLDESAAEFVLHLDDDLTPNSDLLEQYGCKLKAIDETVVGLVGLVRFPRSPTLPLSHAAILMSYLTFMFEIAENGSTLYDSPAWGVTANILFRRTTVRFDLAYAKTGGGEDVDYSLRVSKMTHGGKLLAVPEACVIHPFWPVRCGHCRVTFSIGPLVMVHSFKGSLNIAIGLFPMYPRFSLSCPHSYFGWDLGNFWWLLRLWLQILWLTFRTRRNTSTAASRSMATTRS
jgi:glycosyltransferase involved in cell wall biosynthesis